MPAVDLSSKRWGLFFWGTSSIAPIKPTIRVCSPLYSNESASLHYLVINFNLTQLFGVISAPQRAEGHSFLLLNPEGDWLVSDEPANNWSFMFPEKGIPSYADSFPRAWLEMSTAKSAEMHEISDEISQSNQLEMHLCVKSIMTGGDPYDCTSTEQFWHLISKLDQTEVEKLQDMILIWWNVFIVVYVKSLVL